MIRIGARFALLGLCILLLMGCAELPDVPLLQGAPTATPEPTPTPLPTATPDPTADFVGYLSPELGISLQHPESWVVRKSNQLQLASDPALFADTAGETTGALLAIRRVDNVSGDLIEGLESLIGSLEGTRTIDEAQLMTLSGQEAAGKTIISIDDSGIEFTLLFRLIRNDGATVLVSAVTPDHVQFQPLLEAMMATVIVSELPPTPLPPTRTPVPTPLPDEGEEGESDSETDEASESLPALNAGIPADFVIFTDDEHQYSIAYPPSWLVDRDDLDAVIMASSELLLNDNLFGEGGGTVWLFPQELTAGTDPDPVLILEQFIANFPIYDSFELLVPPRPLQINGQNGATSRYDATFQGAPIIADYYVVTRGSRFVVMVSLVARDSLTETEPLIEGMAVSLSIR